MNRSFPNMLFNFWLVICIRSNKARKFCHLIFIREKRMGVYRYNTWMITQIFESVLPFLFKWMQHKHVDLMLRIQRTQHINYAVEAL